MRGKLPLGRSAMHMAAAGDHSECADVLISDACAQGEGGATRLRFPRISASTHSAPHSRMDRKSHRPVEFHRETGRQGLRPLRQAARARDRHGAVLWYPGRLELADVLESVDDSGDTALRTACRAGAAMVRGGPRAAGRQGVPRC